PISSTGHLILASSLLGLDRPEHKEALDAFEIVIQGGAILAVLGLYAQRVAQMARGLVGRDPAGLRLLMFIAAAFVPSAVVGLLLRHAIKQHLFHPAPVLAALFAGGLWMIWLDRARSPSEGAPLESLTFRGALAIRWLVGFLTRHGLAPFGWYRIALSVVLGALLFAGVVELH